MNRSLLTLRYTFTVFHNAVLSGVCLLVPLILFISFQKARLIYSFLCFFLVIPQAVAWVVGNSPFSSNSDIFVRFFLGLEHLVPGVIDFETEVDFQNFLWTQFYLRVFCANQSCEFESGIVFCPTPFDLACRLVDFGVLVESFGFPFASAWQAEIASALDAHASLFFGSYSEEEDLSPVVVVSIEFPDPESV